MSTSTARVVTLLGAESTGKTALARELAQSVQQRTGLRCTWVGETLREWCQREGRTPHPQEQAAIAEEQSRRIEQARQTHDVVVADTTALMTAVYSQFLFKDDSLLANALETQRRYALTLVTANDLPWVPEPGMRDGSHVREPVLTQLLTALAAGRVLHDRVQGLGPARLDCALGHLRRRLGLDW